MDNWNNFTLAEWSNFGIADYNAFVLNFVSNLIDFYVDAIGSYLATISSSIFQTVQNTSYYLPRSERNCHE